MEEHVENDFIDEVNFEFISGRKEIKCTIKVGDIIIRISDKEIDVFKITDCSLESVICTKGLIQNVEIYVNYFAYQYNNGIEFYKFNFNELQMKKIMEEIKT